MLGKFGELITLVMFMPIAFYSGEVMMQFHL